MIWRRYAHIMILTGMVFCVVIACSGQLLPEDREFNPYAYKFATHEDSIRASWFWYEKGKQEETDKNGDILVVASDYGRAVELNPLNADAHFQRANALYKGRRYLEALAALEPALKLEPKKIDFWLLQADVLLSMQQKDEAITALNNALRLDPKRGDLWLKKARFYSKPERQRECVEAFKQAINCDPDKKLLYRELIHVCDRFGWFNNSDDTWNDFHQQWPQDIMAWKEHSAMLQRLKRWPEFTLLINRAITLNPDSVALRLEKMRGLGESGMLDRMEEESREILKCDTTQTTRASVYESLLVAYEQNKQWNKGIEAADQLLLIYPDYAWAWETRGRMQAKVGRSANERMADFDSAIVYQPRTVKGIPVFPDPWLGKCEVLVEMGRNNEALHILDSLISIKDDWPDVWKSKAYILAILDKNDEALTCIETALRLDPFDKWSFQFITELSQRKKHIVRERNNANELLQVPDDMDSLTRNRMKAAWNKDRNMATEKDTMDAFQRSNLIDDESSNRKNLDTAEILSHLIKDPLNVHSLQINAVSLARCGKFAEAEQVLLQANMISDTIAATWCNLARVQVQIGKRDEALKSIARAVSIDPNIKVLIVGDPGFKSIRNDSMFVKIVGRKR